MSLKNKRLVAAVLASYTLFVFYLIFTELSSEREALVERVIDGDTIELRGGKRVRLLGIDSPEKKQYYCEEATERLRQLVEGKDVGLEKDATNRDKYGRLLRYVYVDGVFVNLEMVKEGYAVLFTTPKNVKHLEELMKAEDEAKLKRIVVWNLNRS
jgi:micrococcal nuclease